MKNLLNCPICEEKASFYKHLTEVNLFFCQNCKHRFTDYNSIKKKEEYKNDYFVSKHPNWFQNIDFRLFEYLCEIINKNSKKSILDVGCGNGKFLEFVSNYNDKLNLTGIDYYRNKKNKKIKFIYGNINKLQTTKKFDVIISIMVIEHILNLKEFITRQKKLLKKNGIIINVTINESSLLYKIARLLKIFNFIKPIEMLYDKHHLNHFSKYSLQKLYKENSLRIVKEKTILLNLNSLTLPKTNKIISFFYRFCLKFIFFVETIIGNKSQQILIGKIIK